MTGYLYGRIIRVQVAGLTISDLRINVTMSRGVDETQNDGTVRIYNLSDTNEQLIYERGREVIIEAGYQETIAEIFNGQVQRVIRARENLARITTISIGDTVREVDTLGGITNRSYDGDVLVRTIAKDLVLEDLGLELGPLDAIPENATYNNFFWITKTDGALKHLLKSVDCNWFEQDGVIRFNKVGSAQSDASIIDVSPSTGMIYSATQTDEGAEAHMLLNPLITLGSQINLASDNLSGTYKVVGMKHNADNWEGGFVTWVDLRELERAQQVAFDQFSDIA